MGHTPAKPTQHTEQFIANLSFDNDFGVEAVVALGYDGTVLRRIAVTEDGSLKVV